MSCKKMNKKEIIYLAYEAGLVGKPSEKTVEFLEAFYNLAVAVEREACATICDEFPDIGHIGKRLTDEYHSYLIRERG